MFSATRVSLLKIQACMLLGTLAFAESDTEMQSLYSAMANRMVQLLDLPNRLSTNSVQRETEIRGRKSTTTTGMKPVLTEFGEIVWWSVWMEDSWSSAGTRLPKQLTYEISYTKPLEELAFVGLKSDDEGDEAVTENSTALRDSSLWTQMIPLTELFSQINTLNEYTVKYPEDRAFIQGRVELISGQLDFWLFRLPPHLHNTPECLQYFMEHGLGRTFIALYIGFHHHSQLLYYQFLHNTTFEHGREYAARCKSHASALSNLLWTSHTTPNLSCLWIMTGHLLVISSSVHVHTLLFDDQEKQIAQAKLMLEHNFGMLIRLRGYWPSLDHSMSRLFAFHRACRLGMSTSFHMNEWMLQFLQRYAKPLDEEAQKYQITETMWDHLNVLTEHGLQEEAGQ
jgi:hypothetical protein